MQKEDNPFQDVYYHPVSNRYSVAIGSKVIGTYDTLDAAVKARHEATNSTPQGQNEN
jgi:hypothetical protein